MIFSSGDLIEINGETACLVGIQIQSECLRIWFADPLWQDFLKGEQDSIRKFGIAEFIGAYEPYCDSIDLPYFRFCPASSRLR